MYFTFKEIKTALREDYWTELSDYADPDEWLQEFADSLVPVYYSDIISDWKEMPAEFMDSGIDLLPDTARILDRMKADLFNYYQDQARQAYEQVKEGMEDANA